MKPLGQLLLVGTIGLAGCSPRSADIRPHPVPAVTRSTLDAHAQTIAREELARAMTEWQPRRGVIVVLDAKTSAVRAMQGRDGDRDAPDLAATKSYITGSTLKTITFATAIEAGTLTPDAMLDCEARYYGADKLSDRDAYGSLPATDALAVSSNVGASRVFDTLGLPRLLTSLRALHVGDAPGLFPPVEDPRGFDAARLAIGEWLRATPLQMTAAYGAIVNGGVYVEPTFASRTEPKGARVFRAETAKTVMAMLEDIVASDLGTGKLARIDDVRVAGKTGTGELEDGALYASFIGTIPGFKPPFVVLVGLENPKDHGTGASAAAPLFARVASRILGL